MKENRHLISAVAEGSIAEELNIEPGDILISINDTEIEDVFDYHFLVNDDYLEVLVEKGVGNEEEGEQWILEIDKEFDEDLGLTFEKSLMDDYRSCTNKCMFCFIDQMPKGMRETLYFKDDDSRLSFLQGNYITLTNMKDKDIEKIVKYHLCPINISIHTTNPELRCKMLNNRFAGDALKHIDTLYNNAIEMNGQIVLCKGVNDGEELKKSIEDLSKYLPHLRSVSVVPSGLTKYREGLYPLEPFNADEAESVIDLIESYQKKFLEEYGINFIHASDEWYILAGRDFPNEDAYDGYVQLENGVGMMRLLIDEFTEALADSKKTYRDADVKATNISMATGYLAYPVMVRLMDEVMKMYPQLKITVYKIKNDFFGENITVSGLLTGQDIISQLKDKELGDILLLPQNVIRSGEDVFLDDIHLNELGEALNIKTGLTGGSGRELLEGILFGKVYETRKGWKYE
ncbi:MAG: DUF512 domain-containing protein [Lachnospiraceae bacterium]|nr:DUF512 domain-containing protein [Lachnospiraceae bacterium]